MASTALLSSHHPALIPLNTIIGTWRLEALAGCGAFGAVYRAVSAHDEHAPPVALKLAMYPEDPRFEREGELLSRCHHPSIPRLLDRGTWHSPAGTRHPFVVMEWVDGMPLYDQVQLRPPEPSQVRRWLLQLAQALAVLHGHGAIHRDIKGANILVRRSDGRAMLMDFGTGLYPGAATLTPPTTFPGTPLYRSPASWFFEVGFYGDPKALYRPSLADDLYALGVTACRLLTGEYPELAAPSRDDDGTLRQEGVKLPQLLLRSRYIDPVLRAVILRLLSVQPEQRGSAAQLAQELESTLKPFLPSHSGDASDPVKARARARRDRWGWALAGAGLALAAGAWWTLPGRLSPEHSVASAEPVGAESARSGTSGLGDAITSLIEEKGPTASTAEVMGENALPEPVPGQVKPDAKGRCPLKGQISLNGGCWWEATGELEKCQELGGQMFKSACYTPVIPLGRKRPPTSGSTKTP